jgi:hypothetical protein
MRALALLVVWLTVRWPSAVLADEPVTLVVIVNPARNDHVDRRDVARIFLRARHFWNDGSPIVPLNLEAGSALRAAFVARVLVLDPARLAAYWNEQYFHGVFPPTVLASSAAVKRYVANDSRAIGYLDAREVDDTVRVVLTLGE